jgi:signal transduction histidine kinase
LSARLEKRREAAILRASEDAVGRAVFLLEDDSATTENANAQHATLVSGEAALAACARVLGAPGGDARTVLATLARLDAAAAGALRALGSDGTPFDITVNAPGGVLRANGRAAGALALVAVSIDSLAPDPSPPGRPLETPGDLACFLDAHPHPSFIVSPDGRATFVNRAWLEAAGVGSLEDAHARGMGVDRVGLSLAGQALATGEARERMRWTGPSRARRALRFRAVPLETGGAVVWSWDVTAAEAAAAAVARQDAALALVLGEAADAVAMFGTDQRLTYHNRAFARLWDLDPAWLGEAPGHGALLDRLRQARRLPETADYGHFRAEELARHERLAPAPEAIWRVAGDRILRVLSLPHPSGGLVMLFSDITPEIRLKSQFNHLIQVQQATLDKLTDAVAVFGPDARLKLHNDAFGGLWGIPPEALTAETPFDDIVERCVARLHDMQFWTELKGRITDPDPGVREAVRGELNTADGRRLAWQSRPLPDGATLAGFVDVTDTRRLEGALRDREAALDTAEQLKRDFVSSVSYELRTPLTTILGYAELLETTDQALSESARTWVGAVRAAAADLARSVEDILAFAEIDARDMTLLLAETDVGDLLSEAAARWSARAAEGSIEILLTTDEAPGAIHADRESLARVLDHLIDHALTQTPPGGQVTLSARRAHGEVCLEVADNGRGIPFHVQARIFDRFNGEEGAGAGLGLALVKALVELHGGWVAVESEPGIGSTFACHLPEGGQAEESDLSTLA